MHNQDNNFVPRPYKGGWQRKDDRPLERGKHRLNLHIRVPEVRVVQDGKQLGIMKTSEALALANEAGLDLVEIAPQGAPPVCSIMDYGEFKFKEKIKEKEAARKQRESSSQVKEVRISPSIGDHDMEVKVKQAREFIEDGKRVLVTVIFHRRQLNHKELGFDAIKKFVAALGDKTNVVSEPRMDGNKLNCCIAPK